MAASRRRVGGLAVVGTVVVILSTGTLPVTAAFGDVTPPSDARDGSTSLNSFASATRTIEDQELSPGGTTTVSLEVTIEEPAGKISINDGVMHGEAANPRFDRVDDLSVDFRDGSGTPEFVENRSTGVSVGVTDVPVGTTIVVTYDVTVTDELDGPSSGRYNFRGSVQSNEHTRAVEFTGDSEIEVKRDAADDATPEDTPTDPLPQGEAIATIDDSECEGPTTTAERSGPGVLAFRFTDQRSPGHYVLIDELRLARGGRVVLTDADGTELGRTNYLPRGEHENVPVALDELLGPGEHEITATVRDAFSENNARDATITVEVGNHGSRPRNLTVSAPARVAITEDAVIEFSASDSESRRDEPQRTSDFVVEFDDDRVSGWETVTIPELDAEEGSYRNGSSVSVSPEEDLDAEPCDLYYVWVVHPESGTGVPAGPIMVVDQRPETTGTTATDGDEEVGDVNEDGTRVSAPGFDAGTAVLALVLTVVCGRWLVLDRESP